MRNDKFLLEKVERLLKEKKTLKDKKNYKRSEDKKSFSSNKKFSNHDIRSRESFSSDNKQRSNFSNYSKEKSNFSQQLKSLDSKDRIAKRMSELGIASRRKSEEMIQESRVKVNGVKIDDLSLLVDYSDTIEVDGKTLNNKPNTTKIFLLNKPIGYICTTNDPKGRPTVFSLLPEKHKNLIAVGRLDYNTEGLLLFTNNGEVARLLELPMTGIKRIYKIRVFGPVPSDMLDKIEQGITVDGMNYAPSRIFIDSQGKSNSWITMILSEGRNREIKNILGHFGLKVTRLIRVQYGKFKLKGVPSGCLVESHEKFDINELKETLTKNIKQKDANKTQQKSYENIKTNIENLKKEIENKKILNEKSDTE